MKFTKYLKKGLAMFLSVLLTIPTLPVTAGGGVKIEEENENSVGSQIPINSVSDNDAAGEIWERQVDVGISSVSAGDADGNIASGVDGNISWVIDADGKLTISGTGDFSEPFADKPWTPYRESIISAEITVSGMTNASGLFWGCANLQSVDVSGVATSNVLYMGSMFSGCNSLTSVDVGGFATSNVIDMGFMFSGCSSLTSVDVSGFATSNVTNMGSMFSGCSSLTSVDVSGFDTGNVTDMGSMFYGCSSLTSVDVSGFATNNVTNMWGMFYGCSSLTSVDVSGFNTSNVTNMSFMFSGCSSLANVNVSGFDTSNVTNMSFMFSGCSSLTSVDVSGFATSNVTGMEFMFERCSNLASVDVSGFDTSNVTDMLEMFYGCSSLVSVDVSGFDTSNVIDMTGMFALCNSLNWIDVSGFDTSKVTRMGAMFLDCSSINNIDTSSFDTSNVTEMFEMFYGCSSLISVDVSGFDTSNVWNMEGMFYNCSSLKNVNVSGFDTRNVELTWRMFAGCANLVNLDLSNFDTVTVKNMTDMFSECSSLIKLDLSSFDASNVIADEYSSMKNMLYNCHSLSEIHTPRNVKEIVLLPEKSGTVWLTPDGTEVTELPQNLSYSVKLTRHYTKGTPEITTTTPDLNMEDVIRVKYVPYSYTVQTNNEYDWNTVTFSIVEGRLAEGLQMYPATGEIYGVPLETGEFPITVRADYSNPDFLPSYAQLTLIVKDNTDINIGTATDPGYDIIQPVPNMSLNALPGSESQVLISKGEYAEFVDLYLDGEKLVQGTDYTSEAGSTRITILNQTLTRKGTGTHTLGIEFRTQDSNELRRAAQNFVVSEISNPGGNGGNGNTGDNGNSGGNGNNNTGSNNNGNNGSSNSGNTGNSGNNDNFGNESNNGKGISDINLPASETDEITIIIYTVMPGDNLRKIAVKFYSSGDYWRKIYADNASLIRNPNRIYVGQRLTIYLTKDKASTESGEYDNTYRVASGDNLWKIAQRVYGDGRLWRWIYEANRAVITNPGKIRGGMLLKIPAL